MLSVLANDIQRKASGVKRFHLIRIHFHLFVVVRSLVSFSNDLKKKKKYFRLTRILCSQRLFLPSLRFNIFHGFYTGFIIVCCVPFRETLREHRMKHSSGVIFSLCLFRRYNAAPSKTLFFCSRNKFSSVFKLLQIVHKNVWRFVRIIFCARETFSFFFFFFTFYI